MATVVAEASPFHNLFGQGCSSAVSAEFQFQFQKMLSTGGVESPWVGPCAHFRAIGGFHRLILFSPSFDLCMRELLFLAGALGGSKMRIQRNAYQSFWCSPSRLHVQRQGLRMGQI